MSIARYVWGTGSDISTLSSCQSMSPSVRPSKPPTPKPSSNPIVSPSFYPTKSRPTLAPSQPTSAPSQASSNATSSSHTPIHQGVCSKDEDSVMNFIFGAGIASAIWLCIGAVLYAGMCITLCENVNACWIEFMITELHSVVMIGKHHPWWAYVRWVIVTCLQT